MIRAMTPAEISKALRRAAEVCIEKDRRDWISVEVCIADGTFHAANACVDDNDGYAIDPWHAATFLLLCAEANDAAA